MQSEKAAVLKMPRRERGEYGRGTIVARRNGRFQIQYRDHTGHRRTETHRTEAMARRVLQRRLAQDDAGVLESSNARIRIDALAESYQLYARNSRPRSAKWIARVWRNHLEPFFGGKQAGRISGDDFQGYIAERLAAGAATSTVNRELAILKAIFYHGQECDPPKVSRVPRFPAKLREPNPRSGFLDAADYGKLQAACPHPWLRALLAVAYNFGFRKGELLGLRVSQIDLKARTIHLLPGETKSGRGRTVVMTREVQRLLSECVKGKRPTDSVFTWKDGRAVKDFRGAWAAMCRAADVQVLLHDLRRAAVRNLIRAGVSRHVAKQISGHTTDSVFDRYDITAPEDLADAARKLEISSRLAADNKVAS